jgi:hypothetical protein
MKKYTKIYLDMDGVLCNFEKRYKDMFGTIPADARTFKEFSPNWQKFILNGQFETLEWFPGGKELLKFVEQTGLKVEMLTSSGGEKYHIEVTTQKLKWLYKNGIDHLANVVAGRKHKAAFATPNSILIDDTPDVIESFTAAGGVGILHKDVKETVEKLKQLLEIH